MDIFTETNKPYFRKQLILYMFSFIVFNAGQEYVNYFPLRHILLNTEVYVRFVK